MCIREDIEGLRPCGLSALAFSRDVVGEVFEVVEWDGSEVVEFDPAMELHASAQRGGWSCRKPVNERPTELQGASGKGDESCDRRCLRDAPFPMRRFREGFDVETHLGCFGVGRRCMLRIGGE